MIPKTLHGQSAIENRIYGIGRAQRRKIMTGLPKRNLIAKDLRTPKYRARVVADKKKKRNKYKCRGKNHAS
jgi:hypothetical protein